MRVFVELSLLETSNQAAITGELLKPCNSALLNEMVMKYGDEGWEKVYDMAVSFISICFWLAV